MIAAWDDEHPEDPVHRARPTAPAWYPDPNQAPVTTRQWAEVTRMRAAAPGGARRQLSEQAKQVRQATQRLRAFLRQPLQDHDLGYFIRVGPAILVPSTARQRR